MVMMFKCHQTIVFNVRIVVHKLRMEVHKNKMTWADSHGLSKRITAKCGIYAKELNSWCG